MLKHKIVYCLSPVYNDWESYMALAQRIAKLQDAYPQYVFNLIAVNDGSAFTPDNFKLKLPYVRIDLKVNVGHQRAIAIGLQYIYNEIQQYDYVLVMDSDGEDRPEDIPELLNKAEAEQSNKIIFAQRKRRRESKVFKAGYFIYKQLFYLLTGQKISFGNYSVIPKKLLSKVVYQENIWNHYSGSIMQSKLPYGKLITDRGTRYYGKSKMNASGLIIHGLSSMAVYFDVLSVRILMFSLYGIGLCTLSVFFILYKKGIGEAIPGWASSLILIISGIVLQLFSVTLIVLLLQLSSRKNIVKPDAKRYLDFVEGTESN